MASNEKEVYTMQGIGCAGGFEQLAQADCTYVYLIKRFETKGRALDKNTRVLWENSPPEQTSLALAMQDPGFLKAPLIIGEFRFFAPYSILSLEPVIT